MRTTGLGAALDGGLSPSDLRDARLLGAQLDVLGGIMAGSSLSDALTALLRTVELVAADGMLGSVLLLDTDGIHLRHCAAPSLPASYNAAIDGLAIGPSVGSCGTAAYRHERVVVEDIATDPLWAPFRDLAAAANVQACWSTPILGSDNSVLGTFAMYYPYPRRPSTADLALIDVLVRTVAMAIERSRADEQRDQALAAERAVALSLQHSLLPTVPPAVGAVRLEARYRAGDPGVEVGGDWFDAVAVDGGLVVVVGDVQGHDVEAAALMGQLRTVVRAFATEGHPPASILARANDYLCRLGTERLATVFTARMDAEARVATVASAGHPPMVVMSPASPGGWHCEGLDVAPGTPLGIGDTWHETSVILPPAAVLLLFTDGLIETRSSDIDAGLARLCTALQALPVGASLTDVLDRALSLIPAGQRKDDVALLAATATARGEAHGYTTQRWLPAQSVSVPLARSWAEGVLRGWALPPSVVETSTLVLSELVSNAARHTDEAIGVTVGLNDGTGEVEVEVFDRSHRLPQLRAAKSDDTAGRGLQVVASLAHTWGVREEPAGKTVWAKLTTTGTTPG